MACVFVRLQLSTSKCMCRKFENSYRSALRFRIQQSLSSATQIDTKYTWRTHGVYATPVQRHEVASTPTLCARLNSVTAGMDKSPFRQKVRFMQVTLPLTLLNWCLMQYTEYFVIQIPQVVNIMPHKNRRYQVPHLIHHIYLFDSLYRCIPLSWITYLW